MFGGVIKEVLTVKELRNNHLIDVDTQCREVIQLGDGLTGRVSNALMKVILNPNQVIHVLYKL